MTLSRKASPDGGGATGAFRGSPGRGRSIPLLGSLCSAVDPSLFVQPPHFRGYRKAPQPLVHNVGGVFMDGQSVPVLYLHYHVKGRWRLPFQDGLLGAPVPGLLVSQSDRLHSANEV